MFSWFPVSLLIILCHLIWLGLFSTVLTFRILLCTALHFCKPSYGVLCLIVLTLATWYCCQSFYFALYHLDHFLPYRFVLGYDLVCSVLLLSSTSLLFAPLPSHIVLRDIGLPYDILFCSVPCFFALCRIFCRVPIYFVLRLRILSCAIFTCPVSSHIVLH